MRRRLVVASVPLLVLLIVAMLIPTAYVGAQRETAVLVSDRLLDSTRFASLTADSLAGDTSRLTAEFDAYADLYDTSLWLIARDGRLLHASGAATDQGVPADAEPMVSAAMAGSQRTPERTVTPFGPDTLSLAVPVGHDSQVSAVLMMEFPTEHAQGAIAQRWLVITLSAAVPATLLIMAVWPIAGWVLKPLRSLERSMERMRRGERQVRADAAHGPPELQGVARSFNAMSHTVEATLQRQQQFVADASHQLRNPLAAVHVGLENLGEHLDEDPESAEVFDEAMQTVTRMEALVEDLLTATDLASAQEPLSTMSTAAMSIAGARTLAEAGGVEFHADIEPGEFIPPRGGLEMVWEELTSNAMRLGGATQITLQGRLATDRVTYCFTFDDDGLGLSADELAHAGTRFWRSPTAQNIDGTGMGLSIISQAVQDVGGAIRLSAADAGGLRVTVELPTAAEAEAPSS